MKNPIHFLHRLPGGKAGASLDLGSWGRMGVGGWPLPINRTQAVPVSKTGQRGE